MSRVAVLDAASLDDELNRVLWTRLSKTLGLFSSGHEEKFKFLLESILFLLTSKQVGNSTTSTTTTTTTTYGSRLNGVVYNCSKRTLYVATILTNYLLEKWPLLSNNNSNTQQNARNSNMLLKLVSVVYNLFDVLLFCGFIANLGGSKGMFPSIKHRLFNTRVLTSGSTSQLTTESPTLNENETTALLNMQTQNQQLLWTGVLELLNTAILKNRRLLIPLLSKLRSLQRGNNNQDLAATTTGNSSRDEPSITCAYCKLFPVNPYQISCCSKIYCYICVVKALEWKRCSVCKKTGNLEAVPVYKL